MVLNLYVLKTLLKHKLVPVSFHNMLSTKESLYIFNYFKLIENSVGIKYFKIGRYLEID